jgi:hypothetical protein
MEHSRPNDLNSRRSTNQRTDEHNGRHQPLRELRRREPRVVLPLITLLTQLVLVGNVGIGIDGRRRMRLERRRRQ